ncbi:MAG TPA: low molecular weight protein-tyrosine-phosphatase [Gammaproteobacteria bacterium]|nr:low molecular weight protein-tyrosine-phosphatase [Gammaproteobacteria bacterium]
MTLKSVLVVCQGNICRSPMAEGFFSHQLSNICSSVSISSAGLAAVVNYPAEPKAYAIMQKHGVDISRHRARQLTDELARQAELILVMTKRQLVVLEHQFLFAKGKTFLLGYWQGFEIQDPLGQTLDVFENIYQQIELSWQDWKTRVLSC